jgi:hypothetical protein
MPASAAMQGAGEQVQVGVNGFSHVLVQTR